MVKRKKSKKVDAKKITAYIQIFLGLALIISSFIVLNYMINKQIQNNYDRENEFIDGLRQVYDDNDLSFGTYEEATHLDHMATRGQLETFSIIMFIIGEIIFVGVMIMMILEGVANLKK